MMMMMMMIFINTAIGWLPGGSGDDDITLELTTQLNHLAAKRMFVFVVCVCVYPYGYTCICLLALYHVFSTSDGLALTLGLCC